MVDTKGYSLDQLARYKYELRQPLGDEIQTLRTEHEKGNHNAPFHPPGLEEHSVLAIEMPRLGALNSQPQCPL